MKSINKISERKSLRSQIKNNISKNNINKKLIFLNENKELIRYAFLNPIGQKSKFSIHFFRDLFFETERIIEQMEKIGQKRNQYLRIVNTVATALYFACINLHYHRSMKFIAKIFNRPSGLISNYKKYLQVS